MCRLLLLAALTSVGAALAHADLEAAAPAQNAVVAAPPGEVALSFSEPVEVRFSTFKVYPLGTGPDRGPGERDAQRLNGLAGALVSDVLTAQGDEAARADTGVATSERASAEVSLPLKGDLRPGHYVVMWRALSIDTHTTSGFYVFAFAPGE